MSLAALLSELGVVCPSCDRLNPPHSSLCGDCGVPFSKPKAVARPAPAPLPSVQPPRLAPVQQPLPPKARPTPVPSRFALVDLNGSSVGQRRRLSGAALILGRSRGAILLEDPCVSAHHAAFSIREGKLFVRDEQSKSGIYVAIREPEPLAVQGQFAAGDRCLKYLGPLSQASIVPGRPQPYGAPLPAAHPLFAVEEILFGGRSGRAAISVGVLSVGQAGCDLSFADANLAPRHCEVVLTSSGASLRDCSSGTSAAVGGTFIRLSPGIERKLELGDRIRIGQQLFGIETA